MIKGMRQMKERTPKQKRRITINYLKKELALVSKHLVFEKSDEKIVNKFLLKFRKAVKPIKERGDLEKISFVGAKSIKSVFTCAVWMKFPDIEEYTILDIEVSPTKNT